MPMTNRLPVGPGSRGGRWHEHEYRLAYHRAWRAAHPEYREREALRKARQRARDSAGDPTRIVESARFPRPLPRPNAGLRCACPDCRCTNTVPVVSCGMCLTGLHEESA